MNIAICAGGTGGHIYPALALAKELKQKHSVYYVGNFKKMEYDIVCNETDLLFLGIDNEGLKPGIKSKFKAVFSQIKAIKQCLKYLEEYSIDFVVCFGGYVTFPLCIAAKLKKIPYLLHEQNAILGKANRYVLKGAFGLAVCYPQLLDDKFENIKLIGNPRASQCRNMTIDINEIKLKYCCDFNKKIVYIVMGSLGSSTVLNYIIEMLNTFYFENIQFIISAGKNNNEDLGLKINNLNFVHIFDFVDQLEVLKISDLVISRAGATSIAEIMACGVPSILIPSPYVANNHQYENAKSCVELNASLMLDEKLMNIDSLKDKIYYALDKKVQNEMKIASKSLSFLNACDNMIQWIEEGESFYDK